jgi:hypothetical protein
MYWVAEQLLASQEGPSTLELVVYGIWPEARTSVWDIRGRFRISHRPKWPAEPGRCTQFLLFPKRNSYRRVPRTRRRVGEHACPPAMLWRCSRQCGSSAGADSMQQHQGPKTPPRPRLKVCHQCSVECFVIVFCRQIGHDRCRLSVRRFNSGCHRASRSCVVFLRSRVRNSARRPAVPAEGARNFISDWSISWVSSVPPGKSGILLQLRLRPLPSSSFSILHSLMILSLDVI